MLQNHNEKSGDGLSRGDHIERQHNDRNYHCFQIKIAVESPAARASAPNVKTTAIAMTSTSKDQLRQPNGFYNFEYNSGWT